MSPKKQATTASRRNGSTQMLSGNATGESSQQNESPSTQGNETTTPNPTLPSSNFPTPAASEVERRPTSEHIESTIRERLPSQNPDNSNRFYMAVDENCPQAGSHEMGFFCRHCRGIIMPWGEDLPEVNDDGGQELLRGQVGTLLEGVRLRSRRAITTLATVAYLEVTEQPHITFDGLAVMESQYPASAQAGYRVARLWRTLRNMNDDEDAVPPYYEIIYRALLEPFMTENALGNSLMTAQTREGRPRRHGGGNALGEPGGSRSGSQPPRDNVQSPETPPPQHQGLGTANGERANGGYTSESEETDDEDDELSDTKLLMAKRVLPPKGFSWNRPAKRRNWEFVPGTDLSQAELGKPDPSKFFLIRQNKDNTNEKDLRQFAGWETFDWDDQINIDSLNRARRQVRNRTIGKTAEPRLPWTQKEHDVLKELVEAAIQSGKHRLSIDWDEISRDMSKRFEGIIQEVGQPMARTSKIVGDKIGSPRGKILTLKTKREETPKRQGSAIRNHAAKYGDIWKMLLESKPLGKRGRRRRKDPKGTEEKPIELDDSGEETESEDEPATKRHRIGPKDMPDRGPKKPPGPPPPGGAGGLAGPMGKNHGFAPIRTPMEAR